MILLEMYSLLVLSNFNKNFCNKNIYIILLKKINFKLIKIKCSYITFKTPSVTQPTTKHTT